MNCSIVLIFTALLAAPASNELNDAGRNKALSTVHAPASPTQVPLSRISTAAFKAQQYCRAELEDFEFDVKFVVISATAYFSGAGFDGTVVQPFTGSSLKPLEKLKAKCVPGSIVLFDNIKVKGPDNEIRTIASVSYLLY